MQRKKMSGRGRNLILAIAVTATAAADFTTARGDTLLDCTRMCAATYRQGRKDCFRAWIDDPTTVDLTRCLAEEKENFCACLQDCFSAQSPPIPFPAWRPHIREENFGPLGFLIPVDPNSTSYTLTAYLGNEVPGYPAASVELSLLQINAGEPVETVVAADTDLTDGIALTFNPSTQPIRDDIGIVLALTYYDASGIVLRGDAAPAFVPSPGSALLLAAGLSFARRRKPI